MAGRGRPGLPTQTKEEKGTHRPDRGPEGEEPQANAAILPPPAHLSKRAKAEWRRLVKELSPLGLFTTLDPVALEAHCVAYDIAARAVEELDRVGQKQASTGKRVDSEGLILDLPNGFQQVNPLLDVIAKFYKLAGEFGGRFGLDPASRSTKVRTPKKQDGAGNRLLAHREKRNRPA